MDQFDPQAYGPVFAPLVAIDRRRSLGAGTPNPADRAALEKLSADAAFAHLQAEFGKRQPIDGDIAACCVSGVWLLHDYLDESHEISQGIDTPEGSFWHAIMHRREGDFSNSKYWLRRVGRHPVFDAIGQRAAELAAVRGAEQAAKKLISGGAWDAFAFVDLCEAAERDQSTEGELCRDIQQAEWELLFDHCYRAAIDM
ncbi:MAG: hypothetical protein WD738_08265 [Pirellulales bacterium]